MANQDSPRDSQTGHSRSGRRRSPIRRSIKRWRKGAANALELVRAGRLGAPYSIPFDIVHETPVYKLRRYHPVGLPETDRQPSSVVLVPPLMVASEVYDISPEISAVRALLTEGLDVWLVDYGAPEDEEGGMERTLDDHVMAVDQSIDIVVETTSGDTHLAGYSQGGMFAYQVGAYRQSRGLASIITFGSPVDVHRNLPLISGKAASRLLSAAKNVIDVPLERVDGIPGFLSSTVFKLLSPAKEVQQIFDFWLRLHDREFLEKRESSRRFLGGEGFVAWPGPALRKFFDEFIVNNRLSSGGFVIAGRTVTLADITCPVLCFIGTNDEIARPGSVRGLRKVATRADITEVEVPAGHFGLVVGSKAIAQTWPRVVDWVRWHDGKTVEPDWLDEDQDDEGDDNERSNSAPGVEFVYDLVTDGVDRVWNGLGDVSSSLTRAVDNFRWQLPRLARLGSMDPNTRISPGQALAEQAEAIPDATFFLWEGRAFSYQDANQRVDNVVRGLVQCGVRRRQRVGVLMDARPSYLTIVAAVSRMAATSVLLSPSDSKDRLRKCLKLGGVDVVVADPENAERISGIFKGTVLVLGGGGEERSLAEGLVDMERIDPDEVVLPPGYEPDSGRAGELATILFTTGKGEELRAARITNRRWAASALGAAAACRLTTRDTVYCCMPLHHAAGILVSVGGALVGGARLAVGWKMSPDIFWRDVRRYGATVSFYAGEMCRGLVDAAPSPDDDKHPLRLFAGSGMRSDVWRRIHERFGVRVLEFYASTEGNCVLANMDDRKIGSVGRPVPGTTDIALLAYDFHADDFVRSADGLCEQVATGQPGVLLARIDSTHPTLGFDGYTDEKATESRVLRDVLERDDAWYITGELMLADSDGDYWFVDRLADIVRTPLGPVPTRDIEDILYQLPQVELAVVHGMEGADGRGSVVVATVLTRDRKAIDAGVLSQFINEQIVPASRPTVIRFPKAVRMTEGFRPRKQPLREQRIGTDNRVPTLIYCDDAGAYLAG